MADKAEVWHQKEFLLIENTERNVNKLFCREDVTNNSL